MKQISDRGTALLGRLQYHGIYTPLLQLLISISETKDFIDSDAGLCRNRSRERKLSLKANLNILRELEEEKRGPFSAEDV